MTGDDRANLARIVAVVADDLDKHGYLAAGVVRRAAQVIAQLPDRDLEVAMDGCPTCGGPVTQPGKGRPRIYCSTSCRHRSRKSA